MAADNKNQVYLPYSHLMNTSPSRKDGISFQHEEWLRRRYVRFLRELGKTLRLPQYPTIASATVLCHRFFLHQSHSLNDCLLIASACLFLAAKAEDTPCLLSRIVSASCKLRVHVMSTSPAAQQLLLAESLVLTTIAFDLNLDHPYDPLSTAIDKLKQYPEMVKELLMLGERNSKKHRAGTHVPLSKFDRGDHQVMAKDHVEINGPFNGGQLLNNISQHQSAYRSSIDHVGGQASAYSNMHSGSISKCVAAFPDGADHPHHWRRTEPTPEGRGVGIITPPTDLQRAGEKVFFQVAWNFVNDSMLTSLCLQFEPHIIAAAAVWLAAKFLHVKLPSEGERVWWRELDVTPLQLDAVGNQILEVCVAVQRDIKPSKSEDCQASGVSEQPQNERRDK